MVPLGVGNVAKLVEIAFNIYQRGFSKVHNASMLASISYTYGNIAM